jgi:hypothetical protein
MAAVLEISSTEGERRDLLFATLAVAPALAVALLPSVPVVALGLWWNANTVAHNFIHRPFFATNRANAAYSAFLSLVLGFPQALWRERHLAHHAERRARTGATPQLVIESALVVALWCGLAAGAARFFWTVYLPGWLLGLALCALHGRYEHASGTVSHYGALYNVLFFNDGYHVEHHKHPGAHWSELPSRRLARTGSRWPAVLRCLEARPLDVLERLVIGSPCLQRFVLRSHTRALERLVGEIGSIREATIVGGGLFPRTALVLERLLPEARLTIVDRSRDHLEEARRFLGEGARLVERSYDGSSSDGADLVVIPLSYAGDRAAIYRRPPAQAVIVHDWIWRPRGATRIVSWLLLKRVNLVRRSSV